MWWCSFFFFFFSSRRRHTRLQGDWSSDVCSSDLFAVLSDSAVLGWSKPDARIFAHTLATLQALPQRAWMVGDNFEADIRGAAGLGLRTCWLAPSDRAPPGGELVPTARISRLPDVERVLE